MRLPRPSHESPGNAAIACARPEPPDRREVQADQLLRGARELVIRHGHSEYRLRLTRNDKLILTK